MTPNVDDFPPCSACGGRLLPLVLCDFCGAASILRDVGKLDWTAPCAECGTFNPWQYICDACHSRFPSPGTRPKPSMSEETSEAPEGPPGRPKRRIKGDADTSALLDLLKVLGLDPSRSQAVIDHGYDALWKLARASPEDLARIPEVGPVAARKMLASLHLIKYAPPQRTTELILQEEYDCPLCGCITSAFAPACFECGASFDEEEMDESIRRQFAAEGDGALLAFYDGRLVETPANPDLLYARALLLQSLGRNDEAIEALDRAAATAPDTRKIKVAQLRLQAKEFRKPKVAEKLRTTANTLMEDVAWDQEVSQLDHLISEAGSVCPSCGAAVPREMALCPSCGARLVVTPGEAVSESTSPQAKGPVKTVAAPELDTLVDDLLVGELEQSLTPEELELTKAAVLDWLIEELEETMDPDAWAEPPSEPALEAEAPAQASPLSTSVGFLSGWVRGSRGLVSGLRPKPASHGAERAGVVNGRGQVKGVVNGVGRSPGLNGLVDPAHAIRKAVRPAGNVTERKAPSGWSLRLAWGLFLTLGLPLGVIAALAPLTAAGIYVEPLRPFWRPWPPDILKPVIGVVGLVATLAYLCYAWAGTRDADGEPRPPSLALRLRRALRRRRFEDTVRPVVSSHEGERRSRPEDSELPPLRPTRAHGGKSESQSLVISPLNR